MRCWFWRQERFAGAQLDGQVAQREMTTVPRRCYLQRSLENPTRRSIDTRFPNASLGESCMVAFEFAEPALLDSDLKMIRAQVRRYVDERIAPNGEAWEAAGEIPREIFRELGGYGLLAMRHPVEYGGGGLGAMSSVVLAEELSRSSFGGVASALTVHSDMSI